MKIIALDPGLAFCGRAVLEAEPGQLPRVVLADTIVTLPENDIEDRLQDLAVAVLELGQADVYVTEEQHGVREGTRHNRNARSDYVLEVVGMFRVLAQAAGRRPDVLTPRAIRARLGLAADAGKEDLLKVGLARTHGLAEQLFKISRKAHREHAADAVAMALAYLCRAC